MPKLVKWLNNYGVVTVLIVLWSIALTTWVTYKMFVDITAISTQATVAFATLFALPSIGVGVWQWRINKLYSNNEE